MQTKRVLITILTLLSVVFLSLQFFQYEMEAAGIRALLLVLLAILYFKVVKTKRLLFFLFLLTFMFSEILNFIGWSIEIYEDQIDYFYFISNGLYMLSYIFLIFQVLKTMKIKDVFLKLPIHIIILFILDVFCVSIVTSTSENMLNIYEYVVEFGYNVIIMTLLSVALINYIYRDDKKSMNFLLGSIFIVFSEIIQSAYFYVSESNSLNVICSLFLVLAFLFFFLQSRLSHDEDAHYLGRI